MDLDRFIDSTERWNRDVADRAIRERVRRCLAEDRQRRITCQDCTTPSCCYQAIFEPLFQALPAARRLRLEGRDTPELRARLRAEGEAMEVTPRDPWWEQQRPCVFLDVAAGRCTIYEQRPVMCRGHLSISPLEYCRPPKRDLEYVFTLDVAVQALTTGWEAHRMIGLRETRMRVLFGAWPRLVAVALQAMDDVAAFPWTVRAQRWPTVDDLGELADRMGSGVKVPLWLEAAR